MRPMILPLGTNHANRADRMHAGHAVSGAGKVTYPMAVRSASVRAYELGLHRFKVPIVGLRCKKSAFAELSCLTVLQRRGLRGSTLLRDDSPLMSDNGGLPRELPRPRTSGAHFPLLPCGGLSPCVPLSAARNKEYSSPLSACLILQYILVCFAVFILQYPQADVNRFGRCPSACTAQARRMGRLVRWYSARHSSRMDSL